MYLRPEGKPMGSYNIPDIDPSDHEVYFASSPSERPSACEEELRHANVLLPSRSPPAGMTRLGRQVRKPKWYEMPD